MSDEKFFTLKELAVRLSVSYSFLWRAVRKGEIESVRLGDGIRIGESAVQAFLAVRRSKKS